MVVRHSVVRGVLGVCVVVCAAFAEDGWPPEGHTALHEAATYGRIDEIASILREGTVAVDAQDVQK